MNTADLVFINGKAATVDRNFSFAQAVAVKDGRILAVGRDEDIRDHIGSRTQVLDLKGRVLLPAAHDSHMHGTSFVTNNRSVNCGVPFVHDLNTLRDALAKEAKRLKPGEWIRGANYNPETFPKDAKPTCRDIDEATGEHPALIMDVTGHGALANSAALRLCGIGADTPDPDGGYLGRYENGEPNGVLKEASGIQLVAVRTPKWTDKELKSGILEIHRMLNEQGYTGYTESTIGPANDNRDYGAAGRHVIDLYKELYREGKFTARVSLGYYTGENGIQTSEKMKQDLEEMPSMEGIDPLWLQMNMTKIFCDGVPTLHSAWMIDEYADQPGWHGRSCLGNTDAGEKEQVEELRKMIMIAHEHDLQAGIHAIGDRAVQETVEAIIAAKQADPEKKARHYVIHGEYHGRQESAKRAAAYKIPYSVQPAVGMFVFETAGAQVGERGPICCDLKTPLDEGVVLCGGSDSIAGEFENWRLAAQVAVTRKSFFSGQTFAPQLRVTVPDVVRMFTINAAFQEGQENVRGSIEPGKIADLQVLDGDIFTEDPDTIGSIGVVMTVADGRIVYENGF